MATSPSTGIELVGEDEGEMLDNSVTTRQSLVFRFGSLKTIARVQYVKHTQNYICRHPRVPPSRQVVKVNTIIPLNAPLAWRKALIEKAVEILRDRGICTVV